MLNMSRGEKVVIRDYKGRPHIRILWDVGDRCAYICSKEQYEHLINGDTFSPAIGFPFSDVYRCDDTIEALINSNAFEWGILDEQR